VRAASTAGATTRNRWKRPAAGLDLRVSAGGNIVERLTAAGWRSYHAIRRRAAELLDRIEVPLSRMDDPVSTFSGGMRQRINLAAGTVRPPRLLLLDEPVSALDAANRELALSLVSSLTSQGVRCLPYFTTWTRSGSWPRG
jgi:alpha-D-ribose 1-methylphosphonate 5-phosphate C-P lyase